MYLRFIGTDKDKDSGVEKGIFSLAYDLRNSGLMNKGEDIHLNELLSWFENNVPIPKILNRRNNSYSMYICWFKDSAGEALDKIWELKYLLENHDIMIEVIKTNDIGHISYNDTYQAVAQPDKSVLKKLIRN